jgi:hypothetical protein
VRAGDGARGQLLDEEEEPPKIPTVQRHDQEDLAVVRERGALPRSGDDVAHDADDEHGFGGDEPAVREPAREARSALLPRRALRGLGTHPGELIVATSSATARRISPDCK